MANQITSVNNFQVPTAVGIVLTIPSNAKAVIQKLTFTSQEASNTQLMTLYAVPPSDTPGATNTLLYKKPVAPGPITDVPEMVNQVLPAGYSLQAIAGSGTVTYLNVAIILVS